MHISGTFLNSKIAKRIALVIFLATFIPTVLITWLTHQTINDLTRETAHKKLVETSKNYALSSFSNLTFARTALVDFADLINTDLKGIQSQHKLSSQIFTSLKLLNEDSSILDESGKSLYPTVDLQKKILANSKKIASNTVQLLILDRKNSDITPVIVLILKIQNARNAKQILVGEINPDFLWGKKSDYPSDVNVCVYQIQEDAKIKLFCSLNDQSKSVNKSLLENFGNWELFLKAEFKDDSWSFVTTRQYESVKNVFGFSSANGYLGVAISSLLFVALLSLIQIRRTMVPLEKLLKSTRNISKGDFTPVQVSQNNEFGELADSFNMMSGHIKQQLETLQALADIDQEIVSKLNVDLLLKKVIKRINQILPNEAIGIAQLINEENSVAICHVVTSTKETLASTVLHISRDEVEIIKTIQNGEVKCFSSESKLVYEQFIAALGGRHHWILPIFWQSRLCAFMSIGSDTSFNQTDPKLHEIREISTRVGIAISAQSHEEKLLLQAQYDNLTGLPNRILLHERINEAIESSNKNSTKFWVAFLDIDKFKFINDSFGHKIGDKLLFDISRRIEKVLNSNDTVARFGGDEFIVLLQIYMDEDKSMQVLEQLMQEIKKVVSIDGKEMVTTCSIGVSTFPAHGTSPETLITNADIAMYQAKERGRNNIQAFTPSMSEIASARIRMETFLRNALAQNEFSVCYQPKVNLKTKKITGMEALIRWNSKEIGSVRPFEFIPLAEESGLIIPIGEWVLKTACEQAVAWRTAGYGDILMSVNISARQFTHKNLIHSITKVLEMTQMDAQFLELEITESLIMDDIEDALELLNQIKSIGVQLSIDDFGTGYSSLAYLKKLPVNTLKIDKTFIDDIVLNTDEVPIVAAIIGLAKNLKFKVVAEGVESKEQLEYLINHSCDEVQGYIFSKPKNASEIEAMLIINKTQEIFN